VIRERTGLCRVWAWAWTQECVPIISITVALLNAIGVYGLSPRKEKGKEEGGKSFVAGFYYTINAGKK